jgi:hypothetical protein
LLAEIEARQAGQKRIENYDCGLEALNAREHAMGVPDGNKLARERPKRSLHCGEVVGIVVDNQDGRLRVRHGNRAPPAFEDFPINNVSGER